MWNKNIKNVITLQKFSALKPLRNFQQKMNESCRQKIESLGSVTFADEVGETEQGK